MGQTVAWENGWTISLPLSKQFPINNQQAPNVDILSR